MHCYYKEMQSIFAVTLLCLLQSEQHQVNHMYML